GAKTSRRRDGELHRSVDKALVCSRETRISEMLPLSAPPSGGSDAKAGMARSARITIGGSLAAGHSKPGGQVPPKIGVIWRWGMRAHPDWGHGPSHTGVATDRAPP